MYDIDWQRYNDITKKRLERLDRGRKKIFSLYVPR